MHHGTCVTHVPWCMPGSLNSGFLNSRWWGKRSRHSRRIRNPQFSISSKRSMVGGWQSIMIYGYGWFGLIFNLIYIEFWTAGSRYIYRHTNTDPINIKVTSHERWGLSNHRQHEYLFNSLLMVAAKIKTTTELHNIGPLWEESTADRFGGFLSQRASNVKSVCVWRSIPFYSNKWNVIGRFVTKTFHA